MKYIKKKYSKSNPKIKATGKGPSKIGCKLGYGQKNMNANTIRKLEALTDIEKEQL